MWPQQPGQRPGNGLPAPFEGRDRLGDLGDRLTEPRPFDLVLWVTGHGVLPFLEDGPFADPRVWNQAGQAFRGQFLSYAIWFN